MNANNVPTKGAAPPGAAPAIRRLSGYLAGRLSRFQRVAVGLVGVALMPVMFVPVLPLWKIFLVAPQYREGLNMMIFVNDLRGDLRNINILNHYIGMQEIRPETFPEFGYMPWVLTVFGVVALLAAIVGRRWLAFLGWIGFAAFGTVMMVHFASWLNEFGTNLDPKAALDFGAFTPPLLGTAVRGNFVIQSYPSWGGYILLVAGLLGPLLVAVDWFRGRAAGKKRRAKQAAASLALLGFLFAGSASATDFISYAEAPRVSDLQALVNAAAPGDTVFLPEGVHPGQLIIDRTLVVVGPRTAILEGEGNGSVVVVRSPGTTLSGFTVRHSGFQLLMDDAAILVDEADSVTIEGLSLIDNNHGIYIRNALSPAVLGCTLVGRSGRVAEENHGNGVHVWYAKDTVVRDNVISGHRDGIYLSFAETAKIQHNLVHDVDRFGLHSMYSQRNTLEQNRFTRNIAGVALMFSNRMEMTGNLFDDNRGHRTYGLLLRDCSDSNFRHNRLVNNTIGLFVDGSNRNRFEGNLFAENGWGVIAYSSSEHNVFTGNTFLQNDLQVSLDMRRTANQLHDEGRGNYWSDARPYDLDGDGWGDAPHSPVSLFAFVSKQHPDLTVFAGSPAVVALDLAQRSLPALQLTALIDPHPQLKPDPIPAFQGPDFPERTQQQAGGFGLFGVCSAAAVLAGIGLLGRRT